ncbi:carboxy methyl transferase for protein phosphatase 2A [Pichia californica]|nr:carboxy methyl transferase for protein phosphatase 2A [[Candida] californica]
MSIDIDDAVRQTDFDALSSRLSCYLKGYTPQDNLILDLIPLIIYYQLISCQSEFKRFALSRKLKSLFFNIFPSNLLDINKILNFNNNEILSKINKFTPLKSPMINRGTYLRTTSITKNILNFCNKNKNLNKIQIISLGSGNDTRPFYILPKFENLSYFELDFQFTTKLKKLAILSSSKLSNTLNLNSLSLSNLPHTFENILSFNPSLNSSNYHLIPCDLRNLNSILNNDQFKYIDPFVPTLIISECCICYLSKDDSNNLISFWRNHLNNAEFLIYEPIGGDSSNIPNNSNSNYGEVMIKNLICRGIEMPTLITYGTINLQIERFNKLINIKNENNKFFDCKIWCKDMKWVYDNQIDINDIDRISRLEMLDEMEELNLINSHYCMIIASWKLL